MSDAAVNACLNYVMDRFLGLSGVHFCNTMFNQWDFGYPCLVMKSPIGYVPCNEKSYWLA